MDKSFKEKMIEYLTYHSHYIKYKGGPTASLRAGALEDVLLDINDGAVEGNDYINDPPDPRVVPPEWESK
jgi:hypothetical protein